MALSVALIYYGGTLNISAGTTFGLEDLTGLGAASVRRLSERGPQQDGDTDLGYRVDPSVLTLPHLLKGTSDAHLDSLRDTLQQAYLPGTAPLNLRVTRDDGDVRQIDVQRIGPLDLPVVRVHRPGHMGKAVVQLKASTPVWYDPTPGTASFLPPSDWWLAFNTIGSANVLEHVENPTQGQAWTYTGTVTAGSPWFLAMRSNQVALGTVVYAWEVKVGSFATGFSVQDDFYNYTIRPVDVAQGTAIMTSGTHNYFFVENGTGWALHRDTTLLASDTVNGSVGISGTARIWRDSATGDPWPTALPKAAVYNINPTPTQLGALNTAMESISSGSIFIVQLPYEGHWPEFPTIRITGPISDPVLTNTSTGETLDFTGFSIGSADAYTIDLRYGRKTVVNSGGDNRISQLSSDSDLAAWHLGAPQEVSGGTNVITLSGTATTGATSALITYYNRYPSY